MKGHPENLAGQIIERGSVSTTLPDGIWKVVQIDQYHRDAPFAHDVHIKEHGKGDDAHVQMIHVKGEEDNCRLKKEDKVHMVQEKESSSYKKSSLDQGNSLSGLSFQADTCVCHACGCRNPILYKHRPHLTRTYKRMENQK